MPHSLRQVFCFRSAVFAAIVLSTLVSRQFGRNGANRLFWRLVPACPLSGNSHSVGKSPHVGLQAMMSAIVSVRLLLALERRAYRRVLRRSGEQC
jgi:hypothetical protein